MERALEMISAYESIAFTHNYIFGYVINKLVYVTFVDHLPVTLVTLGKGSRNSGDCIRFRPTKKVKEWIKAKYPTFALCSNNILESEVKLTKYNRGEIFEKFITEFYGQTWKKDSIPFTKAGDLVIDGVSYQIKFQEATFTTEKTLLRLRGG